MDKTPEQIVALVKQAGVVGAAGAGFPSYVKLQSKAETVIINGSECEPLLFTDQALLKNQSEDIIDGLKVIMHAMGAKEGIVAINRHFTKEIDAIRKVISTGNVRVHLLEDYYPAGDELLLTYDVCKKVVPEGSTPTRVGIAIFNVLTAIQIYQAVNGKPTTDRTVTISGAVHEPKIVTVPIGTRYSDLITMAGGSALKEFSALDGGPMMGQTISNLDTGISKATQGVVVLPKDHFVIRMKSKSLYQTVKESKAASGQNEQATELCPRYLLGHHIEPHKAMIALDYQITEPSHWVTTAFLCSGCGLCELATCDTNFASPKKIYDEYRRLLNQANIQNPHHRSEFQVHSQFENRKMATPILLKKLGLTTYQSRPVFSGKREVSLVKIPLRGRSGTTSQSQVHTGQTVRRGDVVAQPGPQDFGSIEHASIHGTVSQITDEFVEITGVPA